MDWEKFGEISTFRIGAKDEVNGHSKGEKCNQASTCDYMSSTKPRSCVREGNE